MIYLTNQSKTLQLYDYMILILNYFNVKLEKLERLIIYRNDALKVFNSELFGKNLALNLKVLEMYNNKQLCHLPKNFLSENIHTLRFDASGSTCDNGITISSTALKNSKSLKQLALINTNQSYSQLFEDLNLKDLTKLTSLELTNNDI